MNTKLVMNSLKILSFVVLFGFININFIYAQAGDIVPGGVIPVPNPVGDKNLVDIINIAIGFLVTISIPIAVIMILIGSFQMLTAGGNAEQFRRGSKSIMYAIIGFALVLVSKGIITLVREIISGGAAAG